MRGVAAGGARSLLVYYTRPVEFFFPENVNLCGHFYGLLLCIVFVVVLNGLICMIGL